MAFDQDIERRIDATLQTFPESITTKITKKKMFGGLAYLYSGKMTVGIVKDDLMVRIVSAKIGDALQDPHVRPMDFTNRPMKEFVYVSKPGFSREDQLLGWINLGIEHANSVLTEK